ncbi:hypothetical protein Sjap_015316 [Stephania japonica]|uniref:DYW domain-containing protein n=1 Tax=Stephania japonica TaxID=461633 RepID=A0AAP0IIW9_9MAGN
MQHKFRCFGSKDISFTSLLLELCPKVTNQTHLKAIHCAAIKSLSRPDTFLSNNLITLYSKFNRLSYARHTFDQIPHPNLFSWNNILSAYSKSGRLLEMRQLFDRMPIRDAISWNCVISGYANYGSREATVNVYKMMLRNDEGSESLSRITFSTLLILASRQSCIGLGRQVHGQILKFGFGGYVFVGSPLVDMYSKAGFIFDAKKVFEELPERNLVIYNTMISGFLRCGMIEDSKKLFGVMPERDSISWTAMVTGLTKNGLDKEALDVFREMQMEGLVVDQYTFGSALTACGGRRGVEQGMQIHAYVIRKDYMDNVFVGSALVDMYLKCGNIKSAETIFERMTCRNNISWTAMLVGYNHNGLSEEAVKIFCNMQRNGIESDDFTLGSVISSCANLASLEEGTQFHGQALVSGLRSFTTVSNALITLYGKCGSIKDSHQLFNEMHVKDEVSWTALVCGYAQFGKAVETISLFEEMLANGLKPDGVTFIGVLSACSRAGLVDKGYQYFDSMVNDHRIVPVPDHYTCMIDLLSRAGRLEETKDFINQMPARPDAIGWATLLSACRLHGNIEIGKWAADSLIELEPQNPASYVLLSSMYAAKEKWDDVAHLRRGMRNMGARKEPGFSWIKYKNKVHVFSADDCSHDYSDQIYAKLDKLYSEIINEGYVPDMNYVLHDVDEAQKIKMLNHHSEKLAIAFALIFVPESVPIRIVKNLRVCGDCHNATKLISKVTQREILVRDSVRYHLFKDGACSCGDFW